MIFTAQVYGSETLHKQMRLCSTLEKSSWVSTEPYLYSLDTTNPQLDRFCSNGANSRHSDQSIKNTWRTRSVRSLWVICKCLKGHFILVNVHVNSPPSGERYTTIVCMIGLKGECHNSVKKDICSLLQVTWIVQRLLKQYVATLWLKWEAFCYEKGKHSIPA